ncbi:uncharacterized protein LOC127710342 [Mytilus californianus]|uniref:uncharacterized protein LOC127710342 n=1 Tax=Mytilus californianus TaxID=6549 RepID=UPI0022456E42|nr:uncharacterized protein LOC127710342 [Mytilus californianus]
MERLLHLGILKPYQSTSVEAVLIPTEECITDLLSKKNESLSTELDISLLNLRFEVDAKLFETDESLQSNLLESVTNVLTKSNLEEKQKDVTATLLSINNTEIVHMETSLLSPIDKSGKFEKEEKEEEFFINVEDIKCMLRIKGLPQNLEVSDQNDDPPETKSKSN